MKAIQIPEPGVVRITEINKPEPAENEVLIRVRYVGFCGSDLSTYRGKNPMVQYPRIPGHEISGIIEAVGTEAKGGLKTGDHATVVPYTNCGQCPSCKRGRHYACQFNQTLGVQRDGAMTEYIAVPWEKVIKAESLSETELAMVEPLTVGFHAVDRGRVTDSDTVMVMGCGMIGAGAIIRASLRGATVIAVDIDPYKLDLARSIGATHVINSMQKILHDELQAITDGQGPDVVIEAAGNPVTYRAAIDEVAFTGRVVCIGYAASEVSFATKLFVQKELDIMGSRNATAEDFRAVISYLQKGTFPLEEMISARIAKDNVSEIIQKWSDDPGKFMKILLEL